MTPRENPHPELGLSESLRVGLAALDAAATEWALIVLADQPLLRPGVIEQLLVLKRQDRDVIRPLYDGGGPGHPVLVHQRLWPLAKELRGDQGFAAVVPAERVHLVPVPGSNPDVDTPEELLQLSAIHSPLSDPDARPPR